MDCHLKPFTPESLDAFNVDFVKIFTSALGLGLVILGYSYTHTFFRSFGLSLFQLDMEWIDILFRGIALIQDWKVAAIFAGVILFGSAIYSARNLVGPTMKVLITAFTVFGLLLAATWGGQALGYKHARAIWEGGAGKLAFCRFKSNLGALDDLVRKIDELTLEQRIRLIHQSKEHTYLAPVYETVRAGQTTGETYAIPTNFVTYCRVIGS